MNQPASAKKPSSYPSKLLYSEVSRLRGRDGLPELDIYHYALTLQHHYTVDAVPHVDEAIRNLEKEHGIEFASPQRKRTSMFLFFERFKPREPDLLV